MPVEREKNSFSQANRRRVRRIAGAGVERERAKQLFLKTEDDDGGRTNVSSLSSCTYVPK